MSAIIVQHTGWGVASSASDSKPDSIAPILGQMKEAWNVMRG